VFTFLQQVLDQVITQFPCPYIHIGGDEVPKVSVEGGERWGLWRGGGGWWCVCGGGGAGQEQWAGLWWVVGEKGTGLVGDGGEDGACRGSKVVL
jgi:hypothetical protein